MELTQKLKDQYKANFNKATILPDWKDSVEQAVDKINHNKAVYQQVQEATGVPWHIVAVIHGLESDFDFRTHLHNGDPLSARTVHVPSGRPAKGMPPFTWLDSAIDALNYDGASSYKDWSLEGELFFLEAYNGTGYLEHHPQTLSPYLWSGTSVQTKGKYVADGQWDGNAQSDQVGCVAMIKELQSRGLIGGNKSEQPVSKGSDPTWFDVQSFFGSPAVTGYAGEKPVVQLTTKSSHELARWLLTFPEHDILVAPATKPIPQLVDSEPQAEPTQKSINQKLLEYCTNKDNYLKVANEVLQFYPDGTHNGCAAYCSTFLRDIGLAVPIKDNDKGDNISLVAQSLADWLLEQGWLKVAVKDIQAGDVVVTEDNPDWPGYAAHIYIAVSEPQDGNVLTVDNQGFTHSRNLYDGPKTPAAYALRAP